jgi:hypothetical protein
MFAVAALYDGLLGMLFLAAPGRVFETFQITPPNHFGYVQFPALLLIVFATMFTRIALDPPGRRELIPYGAGLKAAYFAVVFYHHFFGSIPRLWVDFGYLDLAFLALFLAAWFQLKPSRGILDDAASKTGS